MKENRLFTEQVKKIFDHTIFGWIGSLGCAIALVVVLWPVGDKTNMVIWFLCIISIEFIRLYLQTWFKKAADSQPSYMTWGNISLATLFMDGLVWGAAGIFLFPAESTVHQVFIAFIIGGMVAGSVGLFSVMLRAFLAFSIPALFPLALKFFLIDDPIHITMGFMLLLFWGIMLMTANRLKEDILNSFALKYKNIDLISTLQNEVETRKSAERNLYKKNKEIESIIEERTSELKNTNIKLTHEIEERISIAKAFRESEAEYRDLIENINDVIFSIDMSGIVDYISPVVESIIGYQASEVIGKHFSEYIYQEDQSLVINRFHEVLAGGSTEDRYRLVSKSGDFRWARSSTRTITKDGQVIGLRGILSDITEQKQAERALKESEKKYRLLADNVSDIIWTMDMDLNFTYFSPSIQRLQGFTVEEAMSLSIEQLITPTSLEAVRKVIAEQLALDEKGDRSPDTSNHIEAEFYCKDGSTILADIEANFIYGSTGQPESIIGVARDITERKKTEAALLKSEERFKILFEFAPDAYYLHDMNGNFLDGNRNSEDLLGYRKADLIGKNFIEAGILAPDDRIRIIRLLAKSKEGKATGPDEFAIKKIDGQTVSVEIMTHPITLDGQDVVLGIAERYYRPEIHTGPAAAEL